MPRKNTEWLNKGNVCAFKNFSFTTTEPNFKTIAVKTVHRLSVIRVHVIIFVTTLAIAEFISNGNVPVFSTVVSGHKKGAPLWGYYITLVVTITTAAGPSKI